MFLKSDIYDMFNNCSSLKSIDMSDFDCADMVMVARAFYGCSSLEYLDISELHTSSINPYDSSGLRQLFGKCSSLKTVILGDSFSFYGKASNTNTDNHAFLPTPPSTDIYTGKWIREDDIDGRSYTAEELHDEYNSAMSGTWVWQRKPYEYTITFAAGDGVANSMANVNGDYAADFTLPPNTLARFGYDFEYWVDNTGTRYSDGATIPAGTFNAGDTVILTPVWKERITSVTMENGSFEFSIRDGEKATFDGIPAGTAYQVYEEIPDGWVLIKQENVSGVIQPLEEAEAKFTNQYQPGATSVQFSGTKTLDGHAAGAGAYTFELLENDKVIQTKSTLDGGFIQFDIIKYEEAGEHEYTIREVDPKDDTIDYDMHEEIIHVSVKEDEEGKLSSKVTYDADGIVFTNKTRPGSLHLTKNAEGLTNANKEDVFTFDIHLYNENGLPADGSIYWYIVGTEDAEDTGGTEG